LASGNSKSPISGQGQLLLDPKSPISRQAYGHFQASKSPIFWTDIWGSFWGFGWMASKLAIREVEKNQSHDFVDKHLVKIFV